MDDLTRVLHTLNASEQLPDLTATFRRDTDGVWHLIEATTTGRTETLSGLLASIEEA